MEIGVGIIAVEFQTIGKCLISIPAEIHGGNRDEIVCSDFHAWTPVVWTVNDVYFFGNFQI